MTSVCKGVMGRFISRADALRLSMEILEKAERERLIAAEHEAAQGIQWEGTGATTEVDNDILRQF